MKPATDSGRTFGWVPLLLLVAAVSVLWVLMPHQEDDADRSGVAPDSGTGAEAGGPGAGTFEGDPRVATGGTPRDPNVVHPPDRVYVSSGTTEGLIRGRVLLLPGLEWPRTVTLTLSTQGEGTMLQVLSAGEESTDFRFDPVPFGDYRLAVSADGFQDHAHLLTVSDRTPDLYQQVVLEPDARAIGVVRDVQGRPVVDVPVTVIPWTEPPRSGVPRTARTVAEGAYEISGLAPGEYEVFPGTLRHPLGDAKRILITPSAREGWAELVVPELGAARVTLVDEAGGNDLSEVRVQATLRGEPGRPGYTESVTADADGAARFPALPPGDYAFQAYGGVFRRTGGNATVHAGAEAEVTIALLPFRDGGQD